MNFCSKCEFWNKFTNSITYIPNITHCPWCGNRLEEIETATLIEEGKINIFSGEYSKEMWADIVSVESIEDLKDVLYFVCCRIQELELWMRKHIRGE